MSSAEDGTSISNQSTHHKEICCDTTYWREIFDKYDRDDDGKISYAQLKTIIKSRDYAKDLPHNVVEKIMAFADKDLSGYLDFKTFMDIVMRDPKINSLFAHFMTKYIRCVVPPRNPSISLGEWRGRPLYDGAGDGTYEEEYSCWPPAMFMLVQSVTFIILFIVDQQSSDILSERPFTSMLLYNPYRRHEWWRFVTYMMVHVDVLHLLANLGVQIIVGVPLELVHRWWRVGLVYLSGVVAGSLAISFANPRVYLMGCSAGIYALISAHLATIIINWHQMEFALIQLLVFLVFIGADCVSVMRADYSKIEAVAPHVAGFVAGLLVGIGVLRNLEKRPWEKRLWWAAMSVYFTLMMAAIMIHVFWTDYFPLPKNKR